jgi:hypothetical protein
VYLVIVQHYSLISRNKSKYYSGLGAGEYLRGGVRKEEREEGGHLTICPLEAGLEALHALLLARVG